jgi:hypothetical protein
MVPPDVVFLAVNRGCVLTTFKRSEQSSDIERPVPTGKQVI